MWDVIVVAILICSFVLFIGFTNWSDRIVREEDKK